MMKHYVLDACSLVALLQGETGAETVADIINQANRNEIVVSMNKLNLLEVYYDAYRMIGKEQANTMLAEIIKRPIIIIDSISDEVFREAGRLKASYKISLADSIALAQSVVLSASLVTSDHHEFDIIEEKENISFIWIR